MCIDHGPMWMEFVNNTSKPFTHGYRSQFVQIWLSDKKWGSFNGGLIDLRDSYGTYIISNDHALESHIATPSQTGEQILSVPFAANILDAHDTVTMTNTTNFKNPKRQYQRYHTNDDDVSKLPNIDGDAIY